MSTLHATLQRHIDALERVGFGLDEPIDGADAVDAVNEHYEQLVSELEQDIERELNADSDYQEKEGALTVARSALESAREYLDTLGKETMLNLCVCDPRRRAFESICNTIDESLGDET